LPFIPHFGPFDVAKHCSGSSQLTTPQLIPVARGVTSSGIGEEKLVKRRMINVFVRPLDYIGSCNEVLPFELESSSKIFLQQLYCDNGLCKKKFSTTDEICYSSNQCLSQLCGDATAIQPIDGNTIFEGKTCIFDNFVAYDQLKGNRSSDSMVFVIIILLIILLGLIICGYARRLFRKQEENSVDNYSRRVIDPETGEITTLGGRVRRGASILLNRGGSLNRSNS
ncbi:10531_t:CDS:2, partial [Funneliformis mosseae]